MDIGAAARAVIPAAAAIAAVGTWLDAKYDIRSDISQIQCLKRNRQYYDKLTKIHNDSDWSFYHTLHSTYGLNDYTEAFLFEDRSWTYSEFRNEIGRVAQKFQSLGITNRTVVGLYINNSPEFIFAWWALYKIGAIPAPVNTSITREPFKHCLRISSAEFLISTYELFDAAVISLGQDRIDINSSNQTLDYQHSDLPILKTIIIYDYGTYPAVSQTIPEATEKTLIHSNLPPVTREMGDWPKETRPKVYAEDTSQYLFTSGTTGLPKASIWPASFSMMGTSPTRWPMMFEKYRRFYVSTPMFHGGAAFAVLPATHASSGTVILARKFSRRNFWSDIRRTRANGIFYIGEMIRFLVQAPPDPNYPDEKKMHGLEIIYGLGIAPPIWRAFRERFGVPWIAEYYGASEGTIAICNSNFANDAGVGKVAHWGPLMRSRWFGQDTFFIVKIDLETGEVIRNPKTGLCVQCKFDEIGEGINRLVPPMQRMHDYVGAGGAEATEKKKLRNVFKKGDEFVRLGDALSMNSKGYVTFHDRLGDTYRAKGHNISTTEVEMAFLKHPDISSANVFAIPVNKYGYEGQVGCVAVTLSHGASPKMASSTELQCVKELEEWLIRKAGLPPYGVPRFLRVLTDVSEDETEARDLGVSDDVGSERVSLMMKKLKTGLRREGFILPSTSKDRIYWIEREGQGFVELRSDTVEALQHGRARL